MGRNTAESKTFQVSCFMAYPAPVQVDGIATSMQHVHISSCFPGRDVGGRALLVTYSGPTRPTIICPAQTVVQALDNTNFQAPQASSFVQRLQHSRS